ncbi:uncharacterized protein F4812DRAFT_456674 [Daldinia caldariorum]|uniref:uncharacterized protein n=1 Tax=Daldinia caldariorum TaxID=326644 RepID=UPI002008E553|nr:uncharacterized protein F4812DRAFT_456674 [Daldinia caldariorum]KAI1470663.1 hypothetical protein F4812DRAFT_456674 [Daldinia caldariorum]
MLQHTLESNKALAQTYMEEADLIYMGLGEDDRREIDDKLHIEKRLLPHTDTSRAPGFNEEQLQSEEDRLILEQKILNAKRQHLRTQQDDQVPGSQSPSDFKIIARPHMLEGKKMTISFQDVRNPSEKREMSYQLNTSEDVVKGPEIFDGYQIEPQGSGKEMKAVKINQDTFSDTREQRYSGVEDSIQDGPLEKLNKARRILCLLEGELELELVKATENSSSGKGDEAANQRKFLRTAIEDQRKEIQTIEQQIKAEQPVHLTRNDPSASTSTKPDEAAPRSEHDRTTSKNDDVPTSKEVKKKQERRSTRSEPRGRSQTPESDATGSSAEDVEGDDNSV